ncbi:hypothetical protein D3C85_1865900 [compost metagenome]
MRSWMAMPPPRAFTRSMFFGEMVSAWSKNQGRPLNGMSRSTFSNTSSMREIDSS